MDDWVILCYFHGEKKFLHFGRINIESQNYRMALNIIQVLKGKTKTKTPTQQTTLQLFQKGSRAWLQDPPHMRSTCRPARSSCCPQVVMCGSHTHPCISGCTKWTICTSHYWIPGQITHTSGLHSVLCAEILWWQVEEKKQTGYFSTKKLNFTPATCFTQHLLALEQFFPPLHFAHLCLICSWPSLF